MYYDVGQDQDGCNIRHKNMVRGESMAKIDVKFMKGNRALAKKMGSTYKKSAKKSK